MKQTFSFRRFGLLARKHYTENRINYFAGLGAYTLFLLLALHGVLRDSMPSLDRFEAIIIFVTFFAPFILAKINFAPYTHTQRQVEALTLPATKGEKFLFATLNTFVVLAVAIVGLEVVASLVAPRCAELNEFAFVRSITGHWFAGLTEILAIAPIFATSIIFAYTISHKGHVGLSLIATWGAIVLLYAIPSLLINGDGISIATMDFPAFITTLNNHIEVGDTLLECTTEKLVQSRWWNSLIMPAVLLVAAWFKFHEYETK